MEKKRKISVIGNVVLATLLVGGLGLATLQITSDVKQVEVAVAEEEGETPPVIAYEEQAVEPTTEEILRGYLSKFLDPETVTMIVGVISMLGVVLGLVVKLKKLAEKGNVNLVNVNKAVKEAIQEAQSKDNKDIKAALIPVQETMDIMQKTMTAYAKIQVLAQENTPESRLAMLDVIQELGVISVEQVSASKKIIEDAKELKVETEKQVEKIVGEVVEKITSIDSINAVE